jgi:hypothetical protein
MFRPNRPSSGVKDPAARCNTVLFLLFSCLCLLLVTWVNNMFQFWCPSAALVCLTVLFGLLAVAVLNVLAGAGVLCVWWPAIAVNAYSS